MTEQASRIGIGVLGCADIAQRMVLPAIKNVASLDLVAVASRDPLKADAFARRFGCWPVSGYDALLERDDVRAVYVPLPNGLHYEWIGKALKKGKHVIAEKSLAVTSAEVEDLVSMARRSGLVLYENFMFKYHSQLAFARKKLAEGAIGELRAVWCSFGFPPFSAETNIRYDRALGGGALLDAGAYTVQAALLFLGSGAQVAGAHLKRNERYDVDWTGGALLANPEGVCAHLSFGFDNFYQNSIALWGSAGKITLERAFTAPPGFTPRIVIERQNHREEHTLAPDNHFVGILQSFAQAVAGGQHEQQYETMLHQARILNRIRDNANRD